MDFKMLFVTHYRFSYVSFCDLNPPRRLSNSRLITFGRSLGGAVAISLAHSFPDLVSGVIVENTFVSIGAMVDVLMPFLRHIRQFVLCMNWDSAVKIADLKVPIMFIAGDSDELVPPSHMRTLYELATRSVFREFYSVLGGTHNDTFEVAGAEYYRRMAAFIVQHISRSAGASSSSQLAEVAPTQIKYRQEQQVQEQQVQEQQEQCHEAGSGSGGEDDYMMVDKDGEAEVEAGGVALPTMDKHFRVK
jgi:dienelactone hydrolase